MATPELIPVKELARRNDRIFEAAMRMAVEDAKEERLAEKAKAARPRFEVIAADSATVRDMRRSFIHDGHDPRRAHSLDT
jgi:hypothetical protein